MPLALPYLSFISGAAALYLFKLFPITTFLLFSLLIFILFIRYKKKTLIYLIVFLSVFLYTEFRYRGEVSYKKASDTYQQLSQRKDILAFSGFISGLPVTTKYGFIQPVKLRSPLIRGETFLFLESPLRPGAFIQGVASFRAKEARKNPGLMGRGSLFLRPEGEILISDTGMNRWFPDRIRWRLYRYFNQQFSPDVASLLTAIVIGHRERGNSHLYVAYSEIGLAHLMSISGTHFGLFTFMLFSLIRFTSRGLPYRWLVRLTSRVSIDEAAALLTIPVIIFYLLLSGGRIPALRSFIMINIFLLGLLIGRKGLWFLSLLFAAFIIILIDPLSIKSISFQLSFLAVLSIGLTLDLSEQYIRFNRFSPIIQKVIKLILVTAGASIGTMPLALYYFHTIPTMTIFTNLIFIPLICFLILPIGVFGGIIYLITGTFPLHEILQPLVSTVNSIIFYIANFEYISLPVRAFPAIFLPFIYAAVLFSLRKKWRWVLISIGGLLLSILLTLSFSLTDRALSEVTFLDVGQGDGAVIKTSDKKTIVVDTGNTGKEVINYLKYRGIKKVDALILSHKGHDHAGGLWNILQFIPVKEVWDNGLIIYNPPLDEGIIHQKLKAGNSLRSGKTHFLVLHPHRAYYSLYGDDGNNNSLVLRFQDESLSVLFTGDIESDGEDALLTFRKYLESDILKVAHHGSYTSSTVDFLHSVDPTATVISVGTPNPYGHPHKATMRKLSRFKVFRTDRDGAIGVFIVPERGLVVRRYTDYILKELRWFSPLEEFKNLKRLFLLW